MIKTVFSIGDVVKASGTHCLNYTNRKAVVVHIKLRQIGAYFIEYIVELKNGERFITDEKCMELIHKCKDNSKDNCKDIGFNIDLPISNKFYVLESYNCCVNHNIIKFIGISSKQYKTDKERFDPECLIEFYDGSRKYARLGEIRQLELAVEYCRRLSNDIKEWQKADSSFKPSEKDKDNKSFIYRFIADYILSPVKYVGRTIKSFFSC